MSKKYVGKEMIEASRFIHYMEKASPAFVNEVAAKIDVYVKENPEYCDKGNYTHLCNIFGFMAFYRTLVEQGMEEKEAEQTVCKVMYEFMQKQKASFQKLSKKDWFWGLIKKIVPIGFKKGSGYGWAYTWHKKEDPKNIFRFECNSCIYQQIFKKYDCVRFGPDFCYNDIIVYGELARTDFIRTKTLCRGGDLCDFKFVRYKKNEPFKRSESV